MAKLKDLRACRKCGNIFSKHTTYKITIQCPNCGHRHRESID